MRAAAYLHVDITHIHEPPSHNGICDYNNVDHFGCLSLSKLIFITQWHQLVTGVVHCKPLYCFYVHIVHAHRLSNDHPQILSSACRKSINPFKVNTVEYHFYPPKRKRPPFNLMACWNFFYAQYNFFGLWIASPKSSTQ